MKLKNLFYVLLALPLVFAACEDPKGEETKGPKLTVTSALEVEVEAEGGTQMITYTLENAPADAKVSVACEADWITDLTVASSIIYEVAANEGEAREATIVVSYKEQSFDVVVKQAAKPASTVLRFEVTSESTIEFNCNVFSGSIEYILENPIEGVELTAVPNQDWVEVTAISDRYIDFTAQANEGEAREATITISYGILEPVVITLKQAEYIDPSEVVTEFVITDVWANSENGGTQWNVTFVEHDANLGDMQTIISFGLDEANAQRITDGTYSVENGGILVNTASLNGFSRYRDNVSDLATDITKANFKVATDTVNQTISIVGTFSAADVNLSINYNGEIRGMDLGEAIVGAIEHTEWASCTKGWTDTKEMMFKAISADNSLEIQFVVWHTGGTKELPERTYYSLWPKEDNGRDYVNWNDLEEKNLLNPSTRCTYNNVDALLKNDGSSSLIVEKVDGCYKFTYDLIDELNRHFTGVIQATW